jgi:hypothetical protein
MEIPHQINIPEYSGIAYDNMSIQGSKIQSDLLPASGDKLIAAVISNRAEMISESRNS